VTGIAIVGAGTTKSASGTYEMTADTIAGCSCPLFCTCYLRIRPSLKNLQYWFSNSNDGFVLAYSKHRFDGADGNPKYSYDKRNGFTIAWTAKGEVAPQKASK